MDAAVTALRAWLEGWAQLYRTSAAVQATLLFGHLAAVLLAASFAMSADQKIVRARRASGARRFSAIRDWRRAHPVVLTGLALGMAAGIGLLLSDVPRFLPSWIFWLKMALLSVLIANGRVLNRELGRLWISGGRDPRDDDAPPASDDLSPTRDDEWDRLARAAGRSAWLWVAALLAGVLLTTA